MNFDENEFANSYIKHLGNSSFLLEGAIEFIGDIHSKFIISIVTNGFTSIQENRIKKSVIYKYFNDIIISEQLGIAKPNPDIFEYAVNKLGNFNKEEILMVGDNLNSDIRGGFNYNIDTCWFNPNKLKNNTELKPTYEVCNYKELRDLLLK